MESDPKSIQDFFDIFTGTGSIFNYLLPVGILIAVAMVVYAGIMWMSSAGNPEKVKQAQGTLTWAVIGLVLMLLATLLIKTLFDSILSL